jgi:hypothetical protein
MNNLLLEYFPELKKELKITHSKQWTKFLNAFGEICIWVHFSRSRHKYGQGIVLFPKFWNSYFKNSNRWFFDVILELQPYLVTDNHYDYKSGTSKCWIPTDDFMNRSEKFISDYRFKTDLHWKNIVCNIVKPEKTDIILSNVKINSNVFDNIKNYNIEDDLILRTFTDTLLAGLDLEYYTSSSGRLQHPLQNMKTSTRNQLFSGWFNYDIKSCAPSVLCQLFAQLEPNISLPYLDSFIPNQSAIRTQIADRTGIPVKDIKQALTAMFFGLTIPSKSQYQWDVNSTIKTDNFKFALINSLGTKSTEALLSDPQFSVIVDETQMIIKRIASDIKQSLKKEDDGWYITNEAGAIKHLPRWNARKAVAHIYFGCERKIIDHIRLELDKLDIKYLLIHDGWIADSIVNAVDLRRLIFVKTRFTLDFTFKKL